MSCWPRSRSVSASHPPQQHNAPPAQPRRRKPRCRRLILGGRDPEVLAYLQRELAAHGCAVDPVTVGL